MSQGSNLPTFHLSGKGKKLYWKDKTCSEVFRWKRKYFDLFGIENLKINEASKL